jgi:hypothetical protein
MKILYAILVVAIVVLSVALVHVSCRKPEEIQVEKTKIVVKTQEKYPISVESQHGIAQAEFFSSEDAQTGVSGLAEASKSFDGTDGDYKDWAASRAVGNDVRANHDEFIKDRIGPQSNYTGRTYIPEGSNDGDIYGHDWIGIRGRPQNVNVDDSASSVTDNDFNKYSNRRKFYVSDV